MFKRLFLAALLVAWFLPVRAADEDHGIVVGTVHKLDEGAKTVAVKTADGTEHTFHFVKETSVHGAKDTGKGADATFHGLKEGSDVAVHYTAKGTEKTAREIDNIGKDGLHSTEGTVERLDRGAKVLVVKTKDGTEETFRLTGNAARDAGKDIGKGTEKSAKVSVHYTEEGGEKVAHFFKRIT